MMEEKEFILEKSNYGTITIKEDCYDNYSHGFHIHCAEGSELTDLMSNLEDGDFVLIKIKKQKRKSE